MHRSFSRTERREERYTALQEKGQKSTMDTLYCAEIKKLTKQGYSVTTVSPHPTIKNLRICEVIFPQTEPKE